ncbi:MAG: hypothetical protein IK144_10000 [Bacteroidaceae bacterium]|nr:hypothetical protein [Bacteroidaceae bacterium]
MRQTASSQVSLIFSFLIIFICTVCRGEELVYLNLRHLNQVDYADSAAVLAMWDELHAASTLQGIVNRKKPRLYVDYVVNGQKAIDAHWWRLYRRKGEWLSGRDTLTLFSVEEAVAHFSGELRGVVAYDSHVPSTSNVASAVAGIENLVAVRYDKAPGSLYSRLCLSEPKLPVRVWLVREDGTPLFTGEGTLPGCKRASSGSVKCDPYLWFIEQYMKTGRCPARCAGYYPDQMWRSMPSRVNCNHHQLTNHDFFVSRKGFFFDLSPWGDEPATDDPSQPLGADLRTLQELLHTADSLGKGEKMCHIGGFPAWAFKYTQRVGGKHEDVATEWQFSELISHYNAFKDADAIDLGAQANASFWQHFPLRKRYPQSWVKRKDLQARGLLDSEGRVDTTRKYIIIYVGDYDAASWLSQMTPLLWDAQERGVSPMMWCISPVLAERVPHVMHYIRQTASPLDYFAAADNGAGYMMPGTAEAQDLAEGTTRHIDAWEAHCKKFYRQWGLTVTGFVIDGNGPAMGKRSLDAYARFSPNGIVPQKCEPASLYGQMPVLRSDWDLVSNDPHEAAQVLVDRIHQCQIPFHWSRCILKSPAWYNEVVREACRLEPSIQLLDAPTFFTLLRCWLQE